jgi:hypothetical protein
MVTSNQFRNPPSIGLMCGSSGDPTAATLALNAAASAEWLAYSFTTDQVKTITDVWVFMSAMNGTLAANDLSCQIYSNGNFLPNADLSSGGVVASAVPTAGTWINFTGLSVALSVGATYWIILKNPATTSGSPTTVYPTYQWFAQFSQTTYVPAGLGLNQGSFNAHTMCKAQSANSGSTWANLSNNVAGWRIGYSDGTYDGFPVSAATTSPSTSKCFNNGSSSVEYGFKFTSPTNATLNVKGVALFFSMSSGVGPMVIKLYTGSSTSACVLAGTTEGINGTQVSSGGLNNGLFFFSSDVVIQPSTVCRVVIADTSSTGTSTKYFTPSIIVVDPNTPTSLIPFDGTMVQTTTPNGTSVVGNSPGTAFTDSSVGTIGFMSLLLDTNGEFAAAGGGSFSPFPGG